MKTRYKKNVMRYRRDYIDIIDWLLAIDLDPDQVNRRIKYKRAFFVEPSLHITSFLNLHGKKMDNKGIYLREC